MGGDPKLRSTNQEVAQMLEQVAALGEDAGEADLAPASGPAANRFAAAVKASLEAAAAAGTAKAAEARWACTPGIGLPVSLLWSQCWWSLSDGLRY